jgi:hypothetical protein
MRTADRDEILFPLKGARLPWKIHRRAAVEALGWSEGLAGAKRIHLPEKTLNPGFHLLPLFAQ